jgi:DNA-binding NtrC family response regulator
MNNRIIVIDDDPDYLEIIKGKLGRIGFKNVRTESDPHSAVSVFENGVDFDLALIDMTMPGMDGIEVLEAIKRTSPGTECIMVTAVNEARVAVECLNRGAYDYLVKPVDADALRLSINRTLERKRLLDIVTLEKSRCAPVLQHAGAFRAIVTRAANLLKVLKEAELHAASRVPVLITGESGTGKELLARAIHAASPRAEFSFTAVNMASVSGNLFEAEFFGHTRGAFTGAAEGRKGYLEHTHGGTLFLDEIGNLPLELQGKLLRFLQDGDYFKLGSSHRKKADVRIVAASNEDLERMMARKLFRKDLYFRIRGGWLQLPPLRERPGDIALLVRFFMKRYRPSSLQAEIDDEAMCLLLEYDYPGNIRELKSIIQSAANLAVDGPIVSDCLPALLKRPKARNRCSDPGSVVSLVQMEKAHILKVYERMGQNKSRTSRVLGIGLNTLRRKLKSYGVT